MFFCWSREGRHGGVVAHWKRRGSRFQVFFLRFGRVTCGTTWHAAGLTAVLGGGVSQIKMLQYAIDLFPQLEKETGMGTGELFAQSRLVTQLDESTPKASIIF